MHGLGSNWERGWTFIDESENGKNWLKDTDMLPAEVPNARIIAFAYESTWLGPEAITQRLRSIAVQFLSALMMSRKVRY